jgi:hypothetical protein
VRVVVTHDVTDDAGALHVPAVRPEAGVEHRVQDLAVHRLQAVPHVRQRPAHDHAHRVVEVRALHLHVEADRLDPATAKIRQIGTDVGGILRVVDLVGLFGLFWLGHVSNLIESSWGTGPVDKPVDMWITRAHKSGRRQ